MSKSGSANAIMSKITSLLDMLNKIDNKSKKFLLSCYHNNQLKKVDNINDFNNYLNKVRHDGFHKLNYEDFYFYKRYSLKKRQEFISVVEALDINLEAISFLDIGPGYGDALDICYERGAAAIHFIDNDPFFFHYNRLKGFTKGYYCSHRTGLYKLNDMKYNFIWSKGSINVDQYAINESKIISYYLDYWLSQIERLAATRCHILICPYWRHDAKVRFVDDLYHNKFTNIMMKHNFTVLRDIKDVCEAIEFPIVFYKLIEK